MSPPSAESSSTPARLDEHKVEVLRGWGEGLQDDPREEVRAAGRAISILVEEIERLNIDLWHARAELLTTDDAAATAPRLVRGVAAKPQPAF